VKALLNQQHPRALSAIGKFYFGHFIKKPRLKFVNTSAMLYFLGRVMVELKVARGTVET
jgi:hypothetical protein